MEISLYLILSNNDNYFETQNIYIPNAKSKHGQLLSLMEGTIFFGADQVKIRSIFNNKNFRY